MKITTINGEFSVCKIQDRKGINLENEFYFLAKTDEEISLVCLTEHVPADVIEREDGWKAFRVQAVLDFSLVGIMAKLSGLLAENGISIFAISTYNTDYILTKANVYQRALTVLIQAGYDVR